MAAHSGKNVAGGRPFDSLALAQAALSFVEGRGPGTRDQLGLRRNSLRPECGPLARTALTLLLASFLIASGLASQGSAPKRVISIVPSVTEMLFAMGAGARVVAVSSYDRFPPEVERLPRVGALIDPDVERIMALRPDLVVTYGSQTDLGTQLRRAGISTFVYRHGNLADISRTMRELGARLGLEASGASLADRLDRDLDSVRARVKGRRRPRTLLVIGRESGSLRSLQVSGGYGFLHDLVDCAGGENVFAEVARESLDVTTETILARAPEVILELHYSDRPGEAAIAAERQAWQTLRAVPAVRNDRVVLLYGGELVVPGPRVARTADLFAQALHPGFESRVPPFDAAQGGLSERTRVDWPNPESRGRQFFFGSATR